MIQRSDPPDDEPGTLEPFLADVVIAVLLLGAVAGTVGLDDETGTRVEEVSDSQQRTVMVEDRGVDQEPLDTDVVGRHQASTCFQRAGRAG